MTQTSGKMVKMSLILYTRWVEALWILLILNLYFSDKTELLLIVGVNYSDDVVSFHSVVSCLELKFFFQATTAHHLC